MTSLHSSSLKALVPHSAPQVVEAAVEDEDADDEDADGLRVGFPVDDWIDFMTHIKETKIICKHIEEAVPRLQFPIGRQQLNISVIDVQESHK